ncbi:MAG: triphosphoribosyl-dephospho-CoA synthase [Sulfolobales archaeon]|jgi:triphosphoribosyl-dephospho-CoA synthetase|nr:triphosphoribosyl-dephospho-CoA synthase [Desulfurococcaceae archaeon]
MPTTEFVISALSLGLLLEALTPNKISTVSYLRGIKNLSISAFISTVPELYKLYKEILQRRDDKVRIGYWIMKSVNNIMSNPDIRTNTCLGYLILTIPLVHTLKYVNDCTNILLITREATKLVLSEIANEDAEDFYNALRTINPSYANKYIGSIPDIRNRDHVGSTTLLKVFIESSYWDLVIYDVINNYEVTLDVYRFMKNLCSDEATNILECISETQLYLLSKFLDSEVLKGFNPTIATLIKSYSNIIRSLPNDKIKNLLKNSLDKYLRINNINTGTLADILALATSFTLITYGTTAPINIPGGRDYEY